MRRLCCCRYSAQEKQRMHKSLFSNFLLVLGVVMLGSFALMEATGLSVDPLLPALSAFCIGGTAVLDRVGAQQFK